MTKTKKHTVDVIAFKVVVDSDEGILLHGCCCDAANFVDKNIITDNVRIGIFQTQL